MEKQIKDIIEATSMGKLEKEAVTESLLNLHNVRNRRELFFLFAGYIHCIGHSSIITKFPMW